MLTVSEISMSYYVCLLACAAFLCFLRLNTVINRFQHRCFLMAVSCILLLAVSEIGELAFSTQGTPSVWRFIFSAAAYSLRPAIPFFIILIPMRGSHKIRDRLNTALLVLNALAAFSSVFWGTVFSFNELNHFERGILAPLPFVTTGIYLAEFLSFAVFRSRQSERQESVICVFIVISCVFSAVVETLNDCRGIVAGISIASVVFYYMYLLMVRLTHDPLTDAYLRSRFTGDVERIKEPAYIVSVDMNGLKLINDTYGHFSGDRALSDFAEAVLKYLPPKAALYRIGGDEFAILYGTDREKNVTELLEKVRGELEGLSLSFSAGYAMFSDKDGFSRAFQKADNMMYEEKRKYHLTVDKAGVKLD